MDKMDSKKRMSISLAIQKELEKSPKIRVLLYLQKHGEASGYKIATSFGWEQSKAHAVIKQLERSNSILTESKIVNGRAVKAIRLIGD